MKFHVIEIFSFCCEWENWSHTPHIELHPHDAINHLSYCSEIMAFGSGPQRIKCKSGLILWKSCGFSFKCVLRRHTLPLLPFLSKFETSREGSIPGIKIWKALSPIKVERQNPEYARSEYRIDYIINSTWWFLNAHRTYLPLSDISALSKSILDLVL